MGDCEVTWFFKANTTRAEWNNGINAFSLVCDVSVSVEEIEKINLSVEEYTPEAN